MTVNESPISQFSINTDPTVIADLEERLRQTRWPDGTGDSGWLFGANLAYMKDLSTHWLGEYDWWAEERALNQFDQFIFHHRDVGIHFVHKKGSGPDPLPLILTHGFPGCFAEFKKLIPLLTNPEENGASKDDAFSVVVPSLPGYGFSDKHFDRGMNVHAIADIWAELMSTLGYERFGAQGGDWGSWVTTLLGLNYPDRIMGLHLNYISTGFRPYIGKNDRPISDVEADYLDRVMKWREAEGAYFAIQATKPQTLSYAIADSPIGLAAWLVEKFENWTDCNGRPDEVFSKDDLITNAMIYWLTNSIRTAFQLYAEARIRPLVFSANEKILPPSGVLYSPRDLPMPPREWVTRSFMNLDHWTTLQRGGHFPAMEAPEALAQDIREFFRPIREHR